MSHARRHGKISDIPLPSGDDVLDAAERAELLGIDSDLFDDVDPPVPAEFAVRVSAEVSRPRNAAVIGRPRVSAAC